MPEDKIKIGDFLIIQRQKFTKLHKFLNIQSTVTLGKDMIELKNAENLPYFTTFKMIQKTSANKKNKKTFELETCSGSIHLKEILDSKESGTDNRHIFDDGLSQNLTSEEITKLRDSCKSSKDIVEQLVENCKTFESKTEYSQAKYIKKKEKKYFEYIQIKKPTIRLIADIYYRQDPDKVLGIRMDALSQLISYSGICSTGNYLLYESGTNGLLPAVLLNSIGAKSDGQLIHLHPGNVPQKQALQAMDFENEQLDRCISVNIYSVLREYYQNFDKHKNNIAEDSENLTNKRKLSETSNNEDSQPTKYIKMTNNDKIVTEESEPVLHLEIPKWKQENDRACELLKEKVDGLVVVAREHPLNILKTLVEFVKPSRPIVIFSLSREILMEIYVELKASNEVTGLRLVTNWMRSYQVLPNRTHPDVNMNANGGFLLYGYVVEDNKI